MKVFKYKKGFATNSSSSHSIISVKDVGLIKNVKTDEYSDFGWNFFTLADEPSKKEYFGILLETALKSAGFSNKMVEDMLGDFMPSESSHIDHQSNYIAKFSNMPRDDVKYFVDAIKAFALKESTIVLGGNDNTYYNHPLANLADEEETHLVDALQEAHYTYGDMRIYESDKGKYFTLFNDLTGSKLRFGFGEDPTNAYHPELVDIKITDYCPFGCEFCYQGSTTKGQHSDWDFSKVAKALHEGGTLEVAIGGGEPTMHPNFVQILRDFRENKVIPNFTTKNLAWLKGEDAEEILELAGAFAYSVSSVKELNKLQSAVLEYGGFDTPIAVHYVMGTSSTEELIEILKQCRDYEFHVTLLGYKTNGRGDLFKPIQQDGILEIISSLSEKNSIGTVSMDTVLAHEIRDKLEAAGINKASYETQDGKFSMYLDAVGGFIAPASYGSMEQKVLCTDSSFGQAIVDNYKEF